MMEPPTPRSQPPIAPSQPDDAQNYERKGMFGQMVNTLKTGWNFPALFKQSVRVGSGSALGAGLDGGDGRIIADGALAGFLFRDRADSTKFANLNKNTTVRLNTTEGGDIWLIDPTTGLFNLSAWTVISGASFTNAWVDASGGTGAPTVRYRKNLFGDVQLVGSIKSGVIGSAAFTLPAGFRPIGTLPLPGVDANATTTMARFDVQAGGAVIPQGGSNVTGLVFNFIFPTV